MYCVNANMCIMLHCALYLCCSRVCAPGEDVHDEPLDTHSFPTAALPCGEQCLEITVRTLPRSTHLPLTTTALIHPLYKTTQKPRITQGEPPRPQGESPRSKEEPPRTQGETPSTQGETPSTQGEPPRSQGETPRTKEEAPRPEGESPRPQKEAHVSSTCTTEELARNNPSVLENGQNGKTDEEPHHTTSTPVGISTACASKTVMRRNEFAPGVTRPGGGSPVPWLNKRRSCAITMKVYHNNYIIYIFIIIIVLRCNLLQYRPRPPVRSNSCPATVPNLCLLGTFEVPLYLMFYTL